MLLVWPKYIFLIKYTLINWNLSTDAEKIFQCVHSYIIFEIQKIRKKLILLFFIRFDLPQRFCCRLKWAGLWKYHYKPLPIQSLVCSWAIVVPKYRRREFSLSIVITAASRITCKLVQQAGIQCVTHHRCVVMRQLASFIEQLNW